MIEAVHKEILALWKTSELEWAEDRPLRYLGMEITEVEEGYHLSQEGYINDLMKERGVQRIGLVPCPKELMVVAEDDLDGEEQPEPEEEDVRKAQKLTGSLLWLSTRCRPDIAFHISWMASLSTKRPEQALLIGEHVLKYLLGTADLGLSFKRKSETVPKIMVFSDASYAPGGGRSFGCIVTTIHGCPTHWKMQKQPVITLSAAEAELYEAVSAVQQGQGAMVLLEEVEGPVGLLPVGVDNTAAIALCNVASGSWKTRHLKVRARYVRQEVAAGRIAVDHVPGDVQLADLGT